MSRRHENNDKNERQKQQNIPKTESPTSRTNVASVGSVFNDMRKVKVLSLSETIKNDVSSEGPTFIFVQAPLVRAPIVSGQPTKNI